MSSCLDCKLNCFNVFFMGAAYTTCPRVFVACVSTPPPFLPFPATPPQHYPYGIFVVTQPDVLTCIVFEQMCGDFTSPDSNSVPLTIYSMSTIMFALWEWPKWYCECLIGSNGICSCIPRCWYFFWRNFYLKPHFVTLIIYVGEDQHVQYKYRLLPMAMVT